MALLKSAHATRTTTIGRRTVGIAAFAMAVYWTPVAAQEKPRIDALDSPKGPERTLVLIKGTPSDEARVVWDAGLPTERILELSLQGALFSVPPNVQTGSHPVAIETSAGRSATSIFSVDGNAPNSEPRIDDIMLIDSRFEPSGMVRTVLYVQGANVDVGAKVLVDEVEEPSRAHKAIRKALIPDQALLRYSIRHYLSREVELKPRAIGSIITVRFQNEGGEKSAPRKYRLPYNATTLDSDGDGIPDIVENNGTFDNASGTVVDLSQFEAGPFRGADPFRKDVFVEVGIMEDARYKPLPGTFDAAQRMFREAPLINPFGENGINLVIDPRKIPGPNAGKLEFRDDDDPVNGKASFDVLREKHFAKSRWGLFHYAIWGKQHVYGISGESNVAFGWIGAGDRFMVTLDLWSSTNNVRSQMETFVHELGHDLGQRHGGDNHFQYKPNYWSVMSYSWQLRTTQDPEWRQKHPTCTQIYYGACGKEETAGAVPQMSGPIRSNYSEGMGADLRGDNRTLNNRLGVCGQPINWDQTGAYDDHGANVDSSYYEEVFESKAVMHDYANWANLKFHDPRVGYAILPLGTPLGRLVVASASRAASDEGAGQRLELQDDLNIRGLRDRLKGQPPIETQNTFVCPFTFSAEVREENRVLTQLSDRQVHIRDLLEELSRMRGIGPEAITTEPISESSVLLRYDLSKLRDSSEIARLPFAKNANHSFADNILQREANVEYRDALTPSRGGERVVALSRNGEIAANAFRSGSKTCCLRDSDRSPLCRANRG